MFSFNGNITARMFFILRGGKYNKKLLPFTILKDIYIWITVFYDFYSDGMKTYNYKSNSLFVILILW